MPFFGGGGASGIGGSTGATDNAILRADGTGAATLQNSDLNIDDASTSTQNNVAITNQHSGQTNSALVLTPKGTGAFIVGPKPDGTATGGNARGANAIDIQTTRSAANQVAEGSNSIVIGNSARTPSTNAIVIGRAALVVGNNGVGIGDAVYYDGSASSVAVGKGAQTITVNGVAIGNTAYAQGSHGISIGANSQAQGDNSIAIGGSSASTTLASGVNACIIGSAAGTANLRAQFLTFPFFSVYWGGQTTNATPTILNLDATATNRFTIGANTAIMADLFIIARRSDTVNKWFSSRRMVAIRRDNANSTAIIGSVQTIGTDQTEGSPTWSVAITADDTNEALQVEVTGAASETVQWRVMAMCRVV